VPSGIVTLLTDFGLSDPFVGVMKGVILGRYPQAKIVDLCHGIIAQDIAHGAFWLERSYGWFPTGTVHVAVVDPGVGSSRAPIAARAHGHFFIGPDNGILGGVIAADASAEVREIEIARFRVPPPSATFQGRDVFAPIAADIAAWTLAFRDVGPTLTNVKGPIVPRAVRTGDRIDGAVVCLDRFGNVITNVDVELLQGISSPIVTIAGIERPLVRTYSDAADGDYLALINSFGTIEIAQRDGDAARGLGIGRFAPVVVRPGP
jgi:S-adenosyl-L-methionine hydrolase (adenosine-forming)